MIEEILKDVNHRMDQAVLHTNMELNKNQLSYISFNDLSFDENFRENERAFICRCKIPCG